MKKLLAFLVFLSTVTISCGLEELTSEELTNVSHELLRRNFIDNPSNRTYYVVDRSKRSVAEDEDRNNRIVPKGRFRRSLNNINTTSAFLNDSHALLVVHWAGEGSNVIIALARDPLVLPLFSSTLYISNNYGATFSKVQLWDPSATIHWFYVSPVYNSHFIFTDLIHKSIWTTSNSGITFSKRVLSFSPVHIMFHPTEWTTVMAFEYKRSSFTIYISTDFCATWRTLHSSAKAVFWGSTTQGDRTADVYIHSASPSSVIKYNYASRTSVQLLTSVDSFQVEKEFLLASKKIPIVSGWKAELWVSTDRTYFSKANLPGNMDYQEIFVADASENQIFVCAVVNNTRANLYISDTTGLYFSLSLEDVVYYNPGGFNNNTWLKYYVTQPFVDLHKVEGLNGVYIATVLSEPLKTLTQTSNSMTMISFNKGGDWRFLPRPSNGTDFFCLFSPNCNLHLAQIYHTFLPSSLTQPIFTSGSAPGLIIASGNTGTSVGNSFDVFISNNGGLNWNKALVGSHHFTTGDHGGIIVAILMNGLTNYLSYSLDEGLTWSVHQFYPTRIRVYGLSTEPGEETGVFTVFGSDASSHSWIIMQINLTTAFSRDCTDSDYTTWTPTDDPMIDCLLGRKMVYEKRKVLSICYNRRNYDREISTENCPCKIDDFECDYGYSRNSTTKRCQPISVRPSSPLGCSPGSLYNRSRGYRRVATDTCEGGMESEFEPVLSNCPVLANGEFAIFSNTSSVYYYSFAYRQTTRIQLRNVENVAALAYNYSGDCLFFADNQEHNIQKICLRGRDEDREQKILLTENTDRIESMTFNWVSQQLFWVDRGQKRIETLNLKNGRRRVVTTGLEDPRSIAIYPKLGYLFWTDWSVPNPRIMRSNMLGTNQSAIVNSSKTSGSLKWPNGLCVDEVYRFLYFVDAGVEKLYHCGLDGNNCYYVALTVNSHPFVTTVFKSNILWSDPIAGSINSVNKLFGGTSARLLVGYPQVVDLQAYATNSQQDSSACKAFPCSDWNALCFELSATTRQCKCEDGFIEVNASSSAGDVVCRCPGGTTLVNNFCERGNSTCPENTFECANKRCIRSAYKCDRDNDCGDYSDETDCGYTCSSYEFQCRNGRCIRSNYLCDGDNDCGDMSDELRDNCSSLLPPCGSNEFRCASGRCIPVSFRCDRDDDCHDGSDEIGCSYYSSTPRPRCSSTEFQCVTGGRCIPTFFKCDGESDCPDDSDEANCPGALVCNGSRVACRDGLRCIYSWEMCNGERDCSDGSDESGCSTLSTRRTTTSTSRPCYQDEFKCRSTTPLQCIPLHEVCDGVTNCLDFSDEATCSNCLPPARFRCRNGACVTSNLRCNGQNDCGDNSDEMLCLTSTTASYCPSPSLRCSGSDRRCIPESFICDGMRDCPGGEDEVNCPNRTASCARGMFSCLFSRICINQTLVCNGRSDCPGGSDELHCSATMVPSGSTTCSPSQFACSFGGCVSSQAVCDSKSDCADGSDETGCSDDLAVGPIVTVRNVSFDGVTYEVKLNASSPSGVNSITVRSLITGSSDRRLSLVETVQKAPSEFPVTRTMGRLRPNSGYYLKVTVIIGRRSSSSAEYYFNTLGRETATPSPPQNVTAGTRWENGTLYLLLAWKPVDNFGYPVTYRIVYSEADESHHHLIELSTNSYKFTSRELEYGVKYTFKVYTLSGVLESQPSETFETTFGSICTQASLAKDQPAVPSFTLDVEHGAPFESAHLVWSVPNGRAYMYTITVAYLETEGDWESELGGHDDDVVVKSFMASQAKDEECKKGISCSATITGLSYGSRYKIEVSTETHDMSAVYPMCGQESLEVLTKDHPYNATIVEKLASEAGGDIYFDLRFPRLPTNFGNAGKLRILYVLNGELKTITANVSIDASHYSSRVSIGRLPSCERYCFYVQLVWPARTPLSSPACLDYTSTQNDPLEAPKNVKVTHLSLNDDRTSDTAFVTWSLPCEPEPTTYLVFVKEIRSDSDVKTNGLQVRDDIGRAVIDCTIYDLIRGSLYNVSVKRDSVNAQMSSPVSFLAEPYPSPINLTYELSIDDDGLILVLSWSEPDDLPASYEYEVYHSSSYRLTKDESSFSVLSSTTSQWFVTGSLPEDIADYSFKVRVKCLTTKNGGKFSNIITVHIPAYSGSSTGEKGNSSWKVAGSVVGAVVLVLLISVVMGYAYVRHRRRSSFDRFATNRFTLDSSRAVFTQLVDDSDQPLINSFSDDDALLVA